jgi:prophage regulatory protein
MTKFLRLPAVIDRTGLSRSTIYEMVERGDFPRPVKIGARAIAWPIERLEDWMAEKVEAA